MLIVYDSLTGLGQRLAEKLGHPTAAITLYITQPLTQPCLLITRSHGFGQITPPTQQFLQLSASWVRGVVVNGNRNWGSNFGAAGDKIQAQYHIPLVLKVEGSGFASDVAFIKQWLASSCVADGVFGDPTFS